MTTRSNRKAKQDTTFKDKLSVTTEQNTGNVSFEIKKGNEGWCMSLIAATSNVTLPKTVENLTTLGINVKMGECALVGIVVSNVVTNMPPLTRILMLTWNEKRKSIIVDLNKGYTHNSARFRRGEISLVGDENLGDEKTPVVIVTQFKGGTSDKIVKTYTSRGIVSIGEQYTTATSSLVCDFLIGKIATRATMDKRIAEAVTAPSNKQSSTESQTENGAANNSEIRDLADSQAEIVQLEAENGRLSLEYNTLKKSMAESEGHFPTQVCKDLISAANAISDTIGSLDDAPWIETLRDIGISYRKDFDLKQGNESSDTDEIGNSEKCALGTEKAIKFINSLLNVIPMQTGFIKTTVGKLQASDSLEDIAKILAHLVAAMRTECGTLVGGAGRARELVQPWIDGNKAHTAVASYIKIATQD